MKILLLLSLIFTISCSRQANKEEIATAKCVCNMKNYTLGTIIDSNMVGIAIVCVDKNTKETYNISISRHTTCFEETK